ncbi:MAG: hypothetical protein KAI47_04070, partial [Deltaproteobacteria bacterium]|nr:hypothetical protein [Deltaproteobacteria bacterium]
CVRVGDEQTNIRLSRELRPRISELSVGPLSYEVVEPYRRIRIAMGENDQGLSYDLEFLGRLTPGEEQPQYGRMNGRVVVNTARYAQLGRARGWIQVGDRRFDVDEDRYYAQRDHSWGIRMGVGAPEQGVQGQDIDPFRAMMITWLTFQFAEWGVQCYAIERADGIMMNMSGAKVHRLGDGVGTSGPAIIGIEHDLFYHPKSARFQGGSMVLRLQGGEAIELSMEELTTMYLRGGGYLGYKGVTHGLWKGSEWADGETWNVGDAVVANEVHGLDDTIVKVRCGDEVGYGIIENLILPPFPRYGF